MINWSDPKSKITPHFSVKEALWLPSWGRLADESDGLDDTIKANIIQTCELLEKIRDHVKAKSINIHSFYRPLKYNVTIGGATKSQHILGCAADFSIPGTDCEDLRKFILPMVLDIWQCRMELKTPSWVHVDTKVVDRQYRTFNP